MDGSQVVDQDPRSLPPLFSLTKLPPFLDVSESTIYALARSGELPIPVIHVGRSMKVRRKDLLDFLGISA